MNIFDPKQRFNLRDAQLFQAKIKADNIFRRTGLFLQKAIFKFPFASAFKMKQHMDKKECFELPDDGHLASQKLSLKDNRGFHLCQMCDFKCKDAKLINKHIR